MIMNDTSISDYIETELAWQLDEPSDINVRGIATDLAEGLKRHGYCNDPYLEYDKALMCPINKRGEKYCGYTICESHDFCERLRKEGYIK